MNDMQCASLKKYVKWTACNRLPSKSKRCRRLAMSFPQKVFAVDGLQLASLEKFLALTTCNSLPSKSFCCRQLAIGFPRKVFAVDGLQFASLKKFLLLTAYNRLPLKSFCCRRLTIGFPQKVRAVDGRKSAFLRGGRMKNLSRMSCRQPTSPVDVGAYYIRPTGTRPSNNRSPLPGRLMGVFDTPLRKPNAGSTVVARKSAFRPFIWPEPARRCGKWRGRPSGDGGQCGARRSS